MPGESELAEAVERLRQRAYAECDEDLHQCMDDCRTVAMAYLALGTRQPDVYTVYLPLGVTMRDESLEAIRRDFPQLKRRGAGG